MVEKDLFKDAAPVDGNYWTYWVHKVQELWKRIEELEERVDALEVLTEDKSGEDDSLKPPQKQVVVNQINPSPLTEKELTVCMALKELGKPASLEEINTHLKNTRMISENLKETLLARLKGAVEKGYVGYDDSNKTFVLLKKSFVVE